MGKRSVKLSRSTGLGRLRYDYGGALKIARANYRQAISYYNNQKNLFLNMLKEANMEAGQINEEKILYHLSTEIEKEFLNEDFGKMTKTFYQEIENMVTNFLKTEQGSQLKQELNSLRDRYRDVDMTQTKNINKLSDKIKKIIEQELSKKQIQGIQTRISHIYREIYKTNINTAAQGAGYGMFRRALMQELTNNKYQMSAHQQGGYTKILSGYYTEAAIANVLNKWASKSSSSLQVMETGVSGGKADVAIGLGSLKELTKQLETIEKFSMNIYSDSIVNKKLSNNKVFSIQSKSWSVPEEYVASRKGAYDKGFMSLGHHQALYASLPVSSNTPSVLRGWHQNVKDLSSRLMTAIGPSNVIYRLGGNKMVWTSALIKELMNKKYYLAFWFTHNRKNQSFEYPATTELAWQKVDNRKQYAKNAHKY